MDMSGEYRIAAPRQTVWNALNDPDVLKQCIPGCEELEKTGENRYRVTLALAGYGPEDVDVEVSDGTLSISGKKKAEGEERDFLHRGIAFREFKREFRLADYVEVTGGSMVNGLLVVDLERKLPEARKPRKVDISTGQAAAETAAE